jgi:hypothetical protein
MGASAASAKLYAVSQARLQGRGTANALAPLPGAKKESAMLDTIHAWSRPITIRLDDGTKIIKTPAEARNFLLMDWPAARGDKHKIASDLCLSAMEGASPEPSWLAFMDAAIEAGIFVE